MADVWSTELLEASYGGMRIDIESPRSSRGNTIARYRRGRRDGAETDNRGANELQVSARVVFFELEDQTENHLQRFRRFEQLCHDGQAHRLVHPYRGAMLAHVEAFDDAASANARDMISVRVTWVEAGEVDVPSALFNASVRSTAGLDVARAEAEHLRRLQADAGIESSVPDEAIATVEGWREAGQSDGGLTARRVNVELATLSSRIRDDVDRYELATDVSRWPISQSITRLAYQLQRAADAFVQTAPRLIDVTVRAPTPLRALVARIYGGERNEERTRQIAELNDIERPGLVDAGTVLRAPAPGAREAAQ